MPEYSYRCKNCDLVFRDLNTVSKRGSTICECGGKAKRDIDAELAFVGRRKKWVTENERWSIAAGVPVKQLAEFRARFPESVYNDKGHLLIKNRKHKLKELKRRDMIELDDGKGPWSD